MKRTLLVLLLVSCGDDEKKVAQPDEYVVDCEELGDAGAGSFASDENYDAFVNAEAAGKVMASTAQAPQVTSPSGTISVSSPPTITFTPTPASATRDAPACRPRRKAPPSLLARLGNLIEGTAEAHCGAFTGENYLLRLRAPGATDAVYMAMLSVTSYTPDAAVWQSALSGRSGQTLELTIERAVFFRGDLSEGPFVQSAPVVLVVGP